MGSDAPKQEITESERASAEIRDRQWQEYLEQKPIQDEYMAQATGYTYDSSGNRQIVEGGRLNADGSVKINTSASQMATEAAATDIGLQQFATGNIDEAIDDNVALATGEAQDSTTKAFQDQSDYLTGIDNVAAMGQGMEAEATSGQLEQAGIAAQNAASRAQELQANRTANRAAAGTLAGLGLGAYYQNQNTAPAPTPTTSLRDYTTEQYT